MSLDEQVTGIASCLIVPLWAVVFVWLMLMIARRSPATQEPAKTKPPDKWPEFPDPGD
jgi:hypothetical protein